MIIQPIRFALLTAWVAILGNGGFCEGGKFNVGKGIAKSLAKGYVRYKRGVPPYKKLFPGGESHEVMYKDQKIELNRNSDGVAIVRADDEIGAIYGQGFMQAIDRPWQIFVTRLLAEGRLSELKEGDELIQLARHSRAMSFCQNDKGRDQIVDAFAQGVTDGMHWLAAEGFKPTEAKILTEPDKMWTASHVMCIVRFILIAMSRGVYEEYSSTMMEASLNPAKVDVQNLLSKLALPSGEVKVEDHPTSEELKAAETKEGTGEWFNFRPTDFTTVAHLQKIGAKLSEAPQIAKGPHFQVSNAASDNAGVPQVSIQGSQSVTVGSGFLDKKIHQPILLSDPHLKVSQPGFWHHIMMVTKKGTIVGGGAVGMPGVMIGHNDNMAWGPTLSYVDKEDLFRVKIVSCGLDEAVQEFHSDFPNGMQCYLYDGKKFPVVPSKQKIENKDGTLAKKIVVRHTHFGPIISDHFDKLWTVAEHLTKKHISEKEIEHSHIALAHASVSRRSPFDGSYITKMFTVKSKDEFKKLLDRSAGMGVTMAYITKANDERKEGEHGLSISGGYPIRHKPEDNKIRNGEKSVNDWKGVLPFDQLPHIEGNPRDYLVTANQRLSKMNLGNSYSAKWRYDRINFLLSKQTVHQMQSETLLFIGADQFSELALQFKKLILAKLVDCHKEKSIHPYTHLPMIQSYLQRNTFNLQLYPSLGETTNKGQLCWVKEEAREEVERTEDALWFISQLLHWDCVIGYNHGIIAVYEHWLMSAAQVWVEGLGGNKEVINTFFGEALDPLVFAMPTRGTHWPGIFLREMESDASAAVILARGLKRSLLKIQQTYPSARDAVENGKLAWGRVQRKVASGTSKHSKPGKEYFDLPLEYYAGGDSSTVFPGFLQVKHLPYEHEDVPADRESPFVGDQFVSSSMRMVANPRDDWKDSWWSLHPGTNSWHTDPFCKSYMKHLKEAIPMPFITYDQFDDYVRDHAYRDRTVATDVCYLMEEDRKRRIYEEKPEQRWAQPNGERYICARKHSVKDRYNYVHPEDDTLFTLKEFYRYDYMQRRKEESEKATVGHVAKCTKRACVNAKKSTVSYARKTGSDFRRMWTEASKRRKEPPSDDDWNLLQGRDGAPVKGPLKNRRFSFSSRRESPGRPNNASRQREGKSSRSRGAAKESPRSSGHSKTKRQTRQTEGKRIPSCSKRSSRVSGESKLKRQEEW